MKDSEDSKVEIDFKDFGGVKIFSDANDILLWLQSEAEFWQWSRKNNFGSYTDYNDIAVVIKRMSAIVNLIDKFKTAITAADLNRISSVIKEFKNSLNYAHGEVPYIPAMSSQAKFIAELKETSEAMAIFAMHFFMGLASSPQLSPCHIVAICRATLYQSGVHKTAKAEREALELLAKKYSEEINKAKDLTSEQEFQCQERLANIDSLSKECNGKLEEAAKQSENRLVEMIKKAMMDLAEIQKLYDEKLALQASVTYWGEKSKSHRQWAIVFALWVVTAFLTTGRLLYESLNIVVGHETISTVPLWKLGLLLTIATIGVWSIRIVVRLMMSNIHLKDDASERRTMLLTYLALLRENKLGEGDNRNLILQSLFRPSSTGIIRDDMAPSFMAQWLKITDDK